MFPLYSLRFLFAVPLSLICVACAAQDTETGVAEAVVAEAIAAEGETSALATASPDRTLRPLTVTIGLTDDIQLTGTLIESTEIAIKTAFGQASIPLSEVAGIRFPAADDNSTTVVMLNGDSITGATDVKFFGIETAWGTAKVNGQSIATLLFVPGLQWTSNVALGGKRWSLIEANAQPGSASTNAAPQFGSQPQPQGTAPGQPAPNRFPSPAQPRVIFGQ